MAKDRKTAPVDPSDSIAAALPRTVNASLLRLATAPDPATSEAYRNVRPSTAPRSTCSTIGSCASVTMAVILDSPVPMTMRTFPPTVLQATADSMSSGTPPTETVAALGPGAAVRLVPIPH